MSLSLKILGSSSSGNCGLLVSQGNYFLVDAGFSGKKIKEKLQYFGISLKDISAVFITHEHQDHIVGLKSLCKLNTIKFYANYKTAQAIEKRYAFNAPWVIFDTGSCFDINELSIQSFSIPHDAVDPVGFLFKHKMLTCAWVTDIGHITESARLFLTQADILVLEANHDSTLLWNHPMRPHYLKERIAGPLGHLSNQEAYTFIKNTPNHWKSIYLTHLSKDCNSVEGLKALFHPLVKKHQYELEIIDPILDP